MDVGSVFGRTWLLYKRNFGWLILAGAIAAAISFVISLITGAIAGGIALSGSSNMSLVNGRFSFSAGASTGTIIGIGALLTGGVLVSQLFALMLEGGMIKMGVSSYRAGASAQLAGLFDGFRHVGAFALFWLVTVSVLFGIFGLVFVVGATMGRIAILLGIVAFVFLIWLYILWVYVIALITDHGLSCGQALSRSREMVLRTGWWKTFLPLFVLGILFFVVMLVVGIAGLGVGSGTSRSVLQVLAEILLMPYAICFLASMYVGAEGLGSPVTGGEQTAWPSPPAPPRFVDAARPPAPPRPIDPLAERAAWIAAADPLANVPRVAPQPVDEAAPAEPPSFVDPLATAFRPPQTPPEPPWTPPALFEEPTA